MTVTKDALCQRIAESLRIVDAKSLQELAEDMAVLNCKTLKDQILLRVGRNIDAQTNKGWPDAYVFTSSNTVYGVEATRDRQSWTKHLSEDLAKAKSSDYLNLSGYFFVAGYPDHEPSADEIKEWTDKFIQIGIAAEDIKLLIGKHLAIELADPKYAYLRQKYLNISPSPLYFSEISEAFLLRSSETLARPPTKDFENGNVFKPAIADQVIQQLEKAGCCLVRGHGACGKTTLAGWIGLNKAKRPFPVYFLDLADLDDEVSLGAVKNEMVELSSLEVLFVIDNIHIDERKTEALLNNWKTSSFPLGSRLLLLGREIKLASGTPLGALNPIVLRAGALELRQIALNKIQAIPRAPKSVPQAVIEQWLHTFGGGRVRVRRSSTRTVDLIAFSAAVQQRRQYLAIGDWRLSVRDAVDAVDERYLRPLTDANSIENLMRLAAVAEYELRVPREALKYPKVGLAKECLDLGLVLSHNGLYSLAHAALGPLLLEASPEFDVKTERVLIASQSPYLGAGMLKRLEDDHEQRNEIATALQTTLSSNRWLLSCQGLHDVANIVDAGVRALGMSAKDLDEIIYDHPRLVVLIGRVRSLETLTSISGRFKARKLLKTARSVYNLTNREVWRSIYANLLAARAGDVLGFLKNVENPEEATQRIDLQEWESSRQTIAMDLGSKTSQLTRLFEKINCPELAHSPALAFVHRAEQQDLYLSDLGDISNIVRHARAPESVLADFFTRLQSQGWLASAYLTTQIGQFCGALMSFANTLPLAIRNQILTSEVEERVQCETTTLNNSCPRSISRYVSMIGAGTALWGDQFPLKQWRWPPALSVEEVYRERAASNESSLGMYELQFWLGVKWLATERKELRAVIDNDIGEAFLQRLLSSKPPTNLAIALHSSLLSWTNECRDRGWKTYPE